MKTTSIYLFIISLFFGNLTAGFSQESQPEPDQDSIVYKDSYGLRVGLDLSKPIRSLIDDHYNGFSLNADYRINDRFYAAFELGNESLSFLENYFKANSEGSYFKIGVNYNTYNNILGMQNEIYIGLRYGYSTFSETLTDYIIYDNDHYFPTDLRHVNQKFKNLSAHWVEFQVGLKTEIVNHVYLGIHAEIKRLITDKSPENFANHWIPGYNRIYDNASFGVGWGYSISYMIPLLKK